MKYVLPFFMLCLSVGLTAQSSVISGRILDDSKLPLAGATIHVEGVQGTIADVDGFYSIIIAPGTYNMVVSYIGFESQEMNIQLSAGENISMDFVLNPGVNLKEIVITSQLRGQARALNNQLTNFNITNIIASDQIGRFPDANIGDALKRVPGINVQYDQGEARFGNIRGTSPQLNSVTINGERIPSAEAENRSIQLDLIPSDMIQTVEVNKAVTPDMDADAIGGSINLVTRAAPFDQRISATLGTGYNSLADEMTYNGSLVFGDRIADNKLGIILSASYFDNNLGSDNIEAEWTYDDQNDNDQFDSGEDFWPEEIQIRQYYLQRIRQSYSLSLDYNFGANHTIFFKGIYNKRKDWENRYRSVFADIENDDGQWVAELERQAKSGTPGTKFARLEDQEVYNYSLSGNHLFGKLSMDWSANYAKASEDRPNERYYEIATDGAVPVTVDFTDPEVPNIRATEVAFQNPSSSWELSEITEEFQYTEDEDINARLDFNLPLAEGANRSNLKFGARIRTKNKFRENDFYEYEPVSDDIFLNSLNNLEDLSKEDFLPGDYTIGSFTSKEHIGNFNLAGSEFDSEQDLSELAGNFTASEDILGAYALLEQNLGSKFQILAGVRFESTDLKYEGFRYDDDAETLNPTPVEESDYSNILPGLHLKYNATQRTILRFAYTNTLARPNYFDLVPFRQIEDGEELSIGNPSLEATTSMNLDLMAEHYFGNIGLISGGLFYKNIDDFIVTQRLDDFTFEGTEWATFFKPVNGGSATLFGIEMAFQRQLDFIAPALSGLGFYFNYTYTTSDVNDFNIEGRENDELDLPGSPKHTLNASLAYEGKKFTSRISLNYASDFIDEIGDETFADRYYDQVTYLDFNASYSVTDKVNIYANINNITNQPLRYYQGISSRTMQAEFYNVRFDVGLKFDLVR